MHVCLTVHMSYHTLDLDAMYLDLTKRHFTAVRQFASYLLLFVFFHS